MDERVREAARQSGISPKVAAQVLASIATYALARFGIDVDANLAAAIAAAAGLAAGVIVGPGRVVTLEPGPEATRFASQQWRETDNPFTEDAP